MGRVGGMKEQARWQRIRLVVEWVLRPLPPSQRFAGYLRWAASGSWWVLRTLPPSQRFAGVQSSAKGNRRVVADGTEIWLSWLIHFGRGDQVVGRVPSG